MRNLWNQQPMKNKEVVEKEAEPEKPMETVSTEEKSQDINNENKEDQPKNVEEKVEISQVVE